MFKSKLVAFTVGTIVVTLVSQALASPISFAGSGLTMDLTIRHNGPNSLLVVRAGEILVDYDAMRLTAYSIDLNHGIQDKWEATKVPVTSIQGGSAAAYLYDSFAGGVRTAAQAAGLQVAIWEVTEDFRGLPDLNAGNFQFSGARSVVQAARGFLNALPNTLHEYSPRAYVLQSGLNPHSQDLIVPEPASLALLASALPILLIGRRR
jgi:hypothetical protein